MPPLMVIGGITQDNKVECQPMIENSDMNRNKTTPLMTLLIIFICIIGMIFLLSREMEHVREFIRRSGWIGVVVSISLYAILGASPIPSEPLTVLLSTLYGPLTATMAAGVGNIIAALIEYYIGERIGSVGDMVRRKEKLPWGLGKFPIDSPVFLITGRFLPGYGPKFVSLISGMFRVPLLRYLWTTAVPTFIGAAIFAYGGFGVLNGFGILSSFKIP